ncbi:MAG: SGNH/GDSL hydrolase family protein [Clostridia bacterium]|nr:SGNH/GDSL hydrolase family protein [Clostridia bacterium]
MNLKGKLIAFLGDSITFGIGASAPEHRYSTVTARALGAVEHNMGISGTVMCSGGHRLCRLPDIDQIPQDADLVFILLGINDFDQCVVSEEATYYALGTPDNSDTSTIYGAANAFCQKLSLRFGKTTTKVVFGTPIESGWNSSVAPGVSDNFDPNKRCACGHTLRELCEAIASTAASYGFAVCDLNREVHVTAEDFIDGLHPNDGGMQKIADVLKAFLCALA